MSNKILSITEKVPQAAMLPDGLYNGTWGGYVITIHYNDKVYECKTEEGVRGIGIKVVVTVQDGLATFESVKN